MRSSAGFRCSADISGTIAATGTIEGPLRLLYTSVYGGAVSINRNVLKACAVPVCNKGERVDGGKIPRGFSVCRGKDERKSCVIFWVCRRDMLDKVCRDYSMYCSLEDSMVSEM